MKYLLQRLRNPPGYIDPEPKALMLEAANLIESYGTRLETVQQRYRDKCGELADMIGQFNDREAELESRLHNARDAWMKYNEAMNGPDMVREASRIDEALNRAVEGQEQADG